MRTQVLSLRDNTAAGTKLLRLGCIVGYCLWWLAASALGAPPEALYDQLISVTAQQYGLDPALVKAVIKCESRFDPWAQSPRGAQGLMQLMPGTQALLGVTNAFDPTHNVTAGVRYLALLKHTFGGHVPLMLAAYNAGPQAVITAGYAVPPFAATQQYIHCVTAAWQQYRQHNVPQLLAPEPQLRLQATALDRYGTLALINDQVLTLGQAILGFTVVHITAGRVDLAGHGKKLSLRLEGSVTP